MAVARFRNTALTHLIAVIAVPLACLVVGLIVPDLIGQRPSALNVLVVAAVGTLGLTLFGLALFDPRRALLLSIMTLPLHGVVFNVGYYVPPFYLVFAFAFVGMLLHGDVRFVKTPLSHPALVFTLVATVSLIMTILSPPPFFTVMTSIQTTPFRGVIQILFFMLQILFLQVFVYVMQDRGWRARALRLHILIGTVIAVLGLYEAMSWFFGLPRLNLVTHAASLKDIIFEAQYFQSGIVLPRVRATFGEPNAFGNYLNSLLPLTLVLLLYRPQAVRKYRLGLLFATVLFAISMLFTVSRGAWLGFAAALIFLVYVFLVRKHSAGVTLRLAGMILSLLVIWVAGSLHLSGASRLDQGLGLLIEPIERMFTQDLAGGGPIPRSFSWQTALDLFRNNPILGTGFGNYGFFAAERLGASVLITMSGWWAQTLAETGALGFFAYALMVFAYFRYLFKALRVAKASPSEPLLIGVIGSSLAQFTHFSGWNDVRLEPWAWFTFALGISVASEVLARSREPVTPSLCQQITPLHRKAEPSL